MPNTKKTSAVRAITIKGTWHDHFANHWYEYPRKTGTDFPQIPSICLRGHWISAAGFHVGEKLEVRVSGDSIVLTVRRKR